MAKKNAPPGPPQLDVHIQPQPFVVAFQVKHAAYPTDVTVTITYPAAGQSDVPPGALTVTGTVSSQQCWLTITLSGGGSIQQQQIQMPPLSWSASGFTVAPSTSYLLTVQANAAGGATASTSESFSTRASRARKRRRVPK